MAWKLPIGEAKEILSKVASKTKRPEKDLSTQYFKLPSPVQDFWINSFGDVVKPGLARERAKLRAAEDFMDSPFAKDYDHALAEADALITANPRITNFFDDFVMAHPKIEIIDDANGPAGFVKPGPDRTLAVDNTADVGTLLHEVAHYGDKARGAADDVAFGMVDPFAAFESIKWLPNTAQEVPLTKAQVYDLSDEIPKGNDQVKFRQWMSPLRGMSDVDINNLSLSETLPALRTSPLANDLHGLDYFIKANGWPNMETISGEGLAQWLEMLPIADDLQKLPISRKIIEHLEDDPRRNFKIDFNKFMEE